MIKGKLTVGILPALRDRDLTLARMSPRENLRANLVWLPGKTLPALAPLRTLLPLARRGLQRFAIDDTDIDFYLGIIKGRLASGMNGAGWQRAYVAQHDHDMTALTCAYREHQLTGQPVHEWTI